MPYQVQVGSQVVEFPDSVGQDEAQRVLAEQFPATGEDIAGAMQDPAFTPTQADYLKFEEYAKTKQTDWVNTIAQSVDAATQMIGSAVAAGAQGAVANPLNYIEGAAQGTRQLYGLVAQSQDPASPLFRFKDLVAGTGTPESRYQQFLEARDFANTTARLERGEEGLFVPPELTNPEFVQGVSLILDPTLALPGVGEIFGAGKLATRAVGKGAQLTGRAIAGAARPLERFAGAAERVAAETVGVTPEALRSTAATAGIAGALGVAPEMATLAAIPAGIRTTREVGEALARAGENLMTQPSRIGPLEAIGAAPGANLRQRMLGVVGQYGGDAALDASLRGLAGGIEGAAVGAGLGFLSGGQEGAAAGLGTGGVQGAAGALGARGLQRLTGKAAKEARAGDLGRFIDAQQDPTTKALFERVRDAHGVDAASALMDLQGLVRGRFGDVEVQYVSNKDFADRFGGSARGVQLDDVGGRPAVVVNADIIGKGTGDGPLYTLGHELFHALEKSSQLEGGATEIKDALVGRWVQEGDIVRKLQEGAFNDAEIEARFSQYRDKLAAGSAERADQLAQYDTIDKKAGYVASELAAEHFASLLAGQKPDALLKGFSGLTRQLLDLALTQNASRALADAAATIERTFGVKPTDSVLFPDLKQASPQLNAMLRDLVRARRRLDERITLANEGPAKVLKPQDASNPIAAKQLVDLGVAEQMPDGSVRNLSDEEIRVREEKDTSALRNILEAVPGARVVDGEIQGRFSPQQLSAIEQSQAVSSRMKDKIRAVNAAMQAGNSLFLNYGAATKRVKNRLTGNYTSRYSSGIRLSQREVLPYSFYLSKADNPVIKAIDISKIRGALDKLTAPDGSVAAGLWDNVDGFMSDLAAYFTNLDAGEGARRSAEIFGIDKARFLGDFVNEQEKGGRKFVRDFRLDRIGSTAPMGFRARISEDAIQKSKLRWMPAETVGDKAIINSEEGYRIISGAKHRLYGPDGKLIGIYDTQTQAERKADATQARLQPEVRQQQYPARDEGRQAAEAGRGDRAVGRTQGQGQGGPVRQAGDVRFMPDGKSAGLAVLDNELTLDLPKRPKVLDIANAFQTLFGKAIEYRKAKPEDNARLVNALVQEIQRAVELHPEAKGWYDENVKLTMDVMLELDPDLAKPENDFIFKAILAATSDGNKVGPQFQQTWKEYSNWKNTGEISGDFVSGDRVRNIKANLEMLNEFIKDVGWEKTKDFMVQKGTVKELRQALIDVFGWTKKQAQSIGSSELTDEVVPFAVILGPKLGSFFNNLYGDFSSVTMDRWFMRTLGRLTGTQVDPIAGAKLREKRNKLRDAVAKLTPSELQVLGIKRGDLKGAAVDATATTIANKFGSKELRIKSAELATKGQTALEETRKFANALKKGLNPLVEAPIDGTHRRWIRERIAEVQKDLRSRGIELENADLQAVLWYLEKELYEKLNYRSKSGESDYAAAASSLYQSVVGRPSDVYARGTGRVGAIGRTGGGEGMGAGQAGQAPRQEPGRGPGGPAGPESARYLPASSAEENIGGRLPISRFGVDPAVRGSDFSDAIRRTKVEHPFGFAVDDKGTEFYTNPSTKLFLSEDGLAGVAVTDYGDLVSVFKHPQSNADIKPILAEAANRSQTLDAFDVNGFLPNLYGNLGFRPVARVPFNREFAPPGWRYDLAGEPDVVLMVRDLPGVSGAPQITGKNYAEVKAKVPSVDYDTAVKLQQEAKQRVAEASKRPQTEVGAQRYMPSDADYLSAVQKGDIQAAQRMVDEAAKAAGYTVGPVYHGTPTGGFNVFDKRMRGESSGISREAFSFTTNKQAAENYSKRLGDDAVRLDAGLRIANDAMRTFEDDVAAQEYFSSKGYSSVEDGMLPEFDWGSIDDVPEFIQELRGYARDLRPINKQLSDSFFQAADEMVVTKARPEVKRVFLRIPGNAPVFQATPKTLGEVMYNFSAEREPTKSGIVELPGNERVYYVADSSQVKLADPVTKDSEGNVIPLSQRFKAGSEDIRYMPSPDSSMPGAYSFPGGYRAIPGKAKGSLRLYGPAGNLIGIASALEEAERIIRRKATR